MKTPDYLIPLEKAFIASANKTDALAMKKYMKNKFEFFGIKAPLRKEIYKNHKAQFGLLPDSNFEDIVVWCWSQPQREYQYFAMEFLSRRMKKAEIDIIRLYEYMLINKSWWDTVDFIAATLVGNYFKKYPLQINTITKEWILIDNIWLQRSCLLFQLKYKENTNTELMAEFIDHLIGSKEFFINKAIGWVLREYSKTNPSYVVDYVEGKSLSGLSLREALKWMLSRGLV